MSGPAHELDRALGRVAAVDLDRAHLDRLDVLRCGDRDRGDGSATIHATEGTVIDADDPDMRFHERPTQRYDPVRGRCRRMSSDVLPVRCPHCGTTFGVLPGSGPATQWIPCPQCRTPVPVVLPRDHPPLFSWEIYPGLYPRYIPPRPPRVRRRPATIYVLLASLVICAGLVGAFGYTAVLAQQPSTYTVSGTVIAPNGLPLAGAQVELTTEADQSSSVTTGLAGTFSFANVPIGGILVNTTKAGYAYTAVYLFLSTVYVSGGSSTGISLTLNPAPANNTTIYVTPFPTLESFVADLGAAAGLLALVAIVDGFAILRTRRSSRPIFGVAAGLGSLLAPLPIALLSIEVAAPIPSLMTIPVAVLGGFAAGIGLVEMALAGQPSEAA